MSLYDSRVWHVLYCIRVLRRSSLSFSVYLLSIISLRTVLFIRLAIESKQHKAAQKQTHFSFWETSLEVEKIEDHYIFTKIKRQSLEMLKGNDRKPAFPLSCFKFLSSLVSINLTVSTGLVVTRYCVYLSHTCTMCIILISTCRANSRLRGLLLFSPLVSASLLRLLTHEYLSIK